MIRPFVKRQITRCAYTWSGLVLLLAGMFVSVGIEAGYIQRMASSSNYWLLGGWRLTLYLTLLFGWSRLVRSATGYRKLDQTLAISRRPLLLLILCYELFIVNNPLAVVFGGGG